jgi:hypothetical protein
MSKKFFKIANAIYQGKLPESAYCIVLRNALVLGSVRSKNGLIDLIEQSRIVQEDELPIEKAMEQTSAKMIFNEVADEAPEASDEPIITLVNVQVICGETEVRLPIMHIKADEVIAWGPANQDEGVSLH